MDANVRALEILQRCERLGRQPSAEGVRALGAYTGWGFCKTLFDDMHWGAMEGTIARHIVVRQDQWEREWGDRAKRVRELLGDEAWADARRSILDAHYTGATVGRALWQAAAHAGFRGGRVLEPACGSGHLLAVMPRELRRRCEIDAVELDQTSASIARLLHPDAKVRHQNFVDAARELEGGYDLIIANVPFGKACPEEIDGEPRYNTHNYFIRRCADLLRPGGILVTLTSASTLQSQPEQRAALAKRLELHAAIRFSSRTFQAVAGTSVIEDLLILRRPVLSDAIEGRNWIATSTLRVDKELAGRGGAEDTEVNEYFVTHRRMVLGRHSLLGTMYGRSDAQYSVHPLETEELEANALQDALTDIPGDTYLPAKKVQGLAAIIRQNRLEHQQRRTILALGELVPGQWVESDGPESGFMWPVGQWDGTNINPPPWRQADGSPTANYVFPRGMDAPRAEAILGAFARLVKVYRRQLALDLDEKISDEGADEHREELRGCYQRCVETIRGRLTESKPLSKLAGEDPFWHLACTLERRVSEVHDGREVFRVELAPVTRQRAYTPRRPPERASTLEEAVRASQGWRGAIEAGYVAELLSITEAEAEEQMVEAEYVFRDPEEGGRLVPREQYLAGRVAARLAAAKAAAEAESGGSAYARNVSALECVQRSTPSLRERFDAQPDGEGPVSLGATWVPHEIIARYMRHALDQDAEWEPVYNARAGRWSVPTVLSSAQAVALGTQERSPTEVARIALNRESTRVMIRTSSGSYFSPEQSEALVQVVAKLKTGWREWLLKPEQAEAFAQVEAALADLGDYRPVRYDGSRLVVKGLSSHFKPRAVQLDAVARNLAEQRGVNALRVGFGKTGMLGITAVESIQRGLARRVMMVCDNANYDQFVAELRALYPHIGIFTFDNAKLHHDRLAQTAAQIAAGGAPIVVLSRTQFLRLRVRPEIEAAFLEEVLDETRDALAELRAEGRRGGGQREAERTLMLREKRLDAKLKKLSAAESVGGLFFDDLGIELLLLDECHKYYRRAPIPYHGEAIKGLPTGESDMATNALLKARVVQARRGGGVGVIGTTGTPLNNTIAEVWAMARMFAPAMLKRFGVEHFKDFLDTFTEQRSELEVDEATMRWKKVTRLSSFKNAPELSRFVASFMESRFDHSEAGISLPKLKGGAYQFETVPISEPVEQLQDMFCGIRDRWEKRSNKRTQTEVPLVMIGLGLAASIDPRLVIRGAPDEPDSLVNTMVRKAIGIYAAAHREGRASAQVIFCDRFRPTTAKFLGKLTMNRLAAEAAAADAAAENPEAIAGEEAFTAEDDEAATDETARGNEGGDGEEEERAKALEAYRQAELRQAAEAAWEFNLHHDIRDKLIEEARRQGVPLDIDGVCVSSDLSNDELKGMCDRVNSGLVPFTIGTARIGIGLNYQRYQESQHHLGPPLQMVPSELIQRVGRGVRQGNTYGEIGIYLWGMEDTASVGVWGRLRYKERMILQFLMGEELGVTWEDPCGQVNYNDLQAVLVRDQRQLRRAELQHAINRERMRMRGLEVRLNDQRQRVYQLTAGIERSLQKAERFAALADEFAKWLPINKDGVSITVQTHQALLRNTEGRFRGSLADARAWLEPKVKAWEGIASADLDRFAVVTINGCPLRLRKWVSLSGHMNLAWEQPQAQADGTFASADGLFMAQRKARKDVAVAEPNARADAQAKEKELVGARAQLAALEQSAGGDTLRELEHEMHELEDDMEKNPSARGRKRQGPRPATPIVPPLALPGPASRFRHRTDAATPVVLTIRRREASEVFPPPSHFSLAAKKRLVSNVRP